MAMPHPRRRSFIGPAIFVLFAMLLLLDIYAEWVWFDSVSYLSVYKTALFAKLSLGIVIFALFFVFLMVNYIVLTRKTAIKKSPFQLYIIFLISAFAGIIGSSMWMLPLKFSTYQPFNLPDPVFENDIGFYIFILPFYSFIIALLLILCIIAIIYMTVLYFIHSQKKKLATETIVEGQVHALRIGMPEKAKGHLAMLAGFVMLVLAVLFFQRRFAVLYSQRGTIFGAGYTDIHVTLPLYALLSLVCLVVAVLCLTYPYARKIKLLTTGFAALGFVLLLGMLAASMTQSFYVQPNEFNLEKPYIEYAIANTLFAYNLHEVRIRDFPVNYNLTIADIERNDATIDNIRVWDWRPLLTTFRQIQLFRTYYDFEDVDVDRYVVNGKLRELMIAPREMDQSQLDDKARSWVNEKFIYTHGYGAVVSQVNSFGNEGLPVMLVQDIPPKSKDPALEINEPRIYFGENTDEYAVVRSTNKEFDYPLGNENAFTEYAGNDGVVLDSILRRFAYSIKLNSINLFVSGAIKDESRVLMNRDVVQRAKKIAPFLNYDSDPYMVIADGNMYWMMDAYTTSSLFPYSERKSGINYVRNSVKVVVDAYHGTITFYAVDNTDPLIQNYMSIFPSLFKDFISMPSSLKEHIRYPEDLMRMQTEIYGTYHMKDPQVFYNKEDVWRAPTEIYESEQVEMRPYYIIMKSPEDGKVGFFLITPYIPRGKENMIAWFTAYSDPEHYGTLEILKLSKQELTYGPMQIEARIDQDTEISQQLTLWNQQGSQVIRGNLLVIPIEESFIYIEPIYLKASKGGALPELKRVVVAYHEQLTMEETLGEALQVIFGKSSIKKDDSKKSTTATDVLMSADDKFKQASLLYEEAQQALTSGDFVLYAEKIEELGRVLGKS